MLAELEQDLVRALLDPLSRGLGLKPRQELRDRVAGVSDLLRFAGHSNARDSVGQLNLSFAPGSLGLGPAAASCWLCLLPSAHGRPTSALGRVCLRSRA